MAVQAIQHQEYDMVDASLPRILWIPESTDLHVNLVVLHGGEAIAEHVNEALDVLLTCLASDGDLHIGGERISLKAGTVVLVPLGTGRGVVAGSEGLRDTTCHRKRGGIIPTLHARE